MPRAEVEQATIEVPTVYLNQPKVVNLTGTSHFTVNALNLFDADRAHIYQNQDVDDSVNRDQWEGQDISGNRPTLAVIADSQSFSGNAIRVTKGTAAGTNEGVISHSNPFAVPLLTVSAATTYAFSLDVTSNVTGTVTIGFGSRNAGGGFLSEGGTQHALIAGQRTRISHTAGSHVNAASAYAFVRYQDDHGIGDYIDIADPHFELGTGTTFYPSVRIGLTYDLRATIAADDWTPVNNTVIAATYETATDLDGFIVEVLTTGNVRMGHGDGTTRRLATIAPDNALTDSGYYTIKALHTGDTAELYVDDVQQGTTTTGLGTDIATSVGDLTYGTKATASAFTDYWQGQVEYIELRDGDDGLLVARLDADDIGTDPPNRVPDGGTFTDNVGTHTVTATGPAITLGWGEKTEGNPVTFDMTFEKDRPHVPIRPPW